jgi:hypothetical protein
MGAVHLQHFLQGACLHAHPTATPRQVIGSGCVKPMMTNLMAFFESIRCLQASTCVHMCMQYACSCSTHSS